MFVFLWNWIVCMFVPFAGTITMFLEGVRGKDIKGRKINNLTLHFLLCFFSLAIDLFLAGYGGNILRGIFRILAKPAKALFGRAGTKVVVSVAAKTGTRVGGRAGVKAGERAAGRVASASEKGVAASSQRIGENAMSNTASAQAKKPGLAKSFTAKRIKGLANRFDGKTQAAGLAIAEFMERNPQLTSMVLDQMDNYVERQKRELMEKAKDTYKHAEQKLREYQEQSEKEGERKDYSLNDFIPKKKEGSEIQDETPDNTLSPEATRKTKIMRALGITKEKLHGFLDKVKQNPEAYEELRNILTDAKKANTENKEGQEATREIENKEPTKTS